jgi:exodeoxyribonuclease V alpha subunit
MDGTSNTAGPPTEALAGLVERVTFHNADTGFCVLRVKVRGQRDPITVVGHAALISAGEFVSGSGVWVNDGVVQNVPFPGNTGKGPSHD